MLILTIVLAATMPILSKRAKYKASVAASSGGNKICAKTVTSSLTATLDPGIIFFYYNIIGGGAGGGYQYYKVVPYYFLAESYGGGGGSSALLIGTSAGTGNVAQVIAQGGQSYSAGNGTNGAAVTGSLSTLNPGTKYYLTVYAGGGGGGAGGGGSLGAINTNTGKGGGGGGAGWTGGGGSWGNYAAVYCTYAGYWTITHGGDESTFSGQAGYCTTTMHGTNGTSLQGGNAYLGALGAGASPGTTSSYGGGGGSFGGNGGNGGIDTNGQSGFTNNPSSPGTGQGGAGLSVSDTTIPMPTTGGLGGSGGVVSIFFVTTASSCPSSW